MFDAGSNLSTGHYRFAITMHWQSAHRGIWLWVSIWGSLPCNSGEASQSLLAAPQGLCKQFSQSPSVTQLCKNPKEKTTSYSRELIWLVRLGNDQRQVLMKPANLPLKEDAVIRRPDNGLTRNVGRGEKKTTLFSTGQLCPKSHHSLASVFV